MDMRFLTVVKSMEPLSLTMEPYFISFPAVMLSKLSRAIGRMSPLEVNSQAAMATPNLKSGCLVRSM